LGQGGTAGRGATRWGAQVQKGVAISTTKKLQVHRDGGTSTKGRGGCKDARWGLNIQGGAQASNIGGCNCIRGGKGIHMWWQRCVSTWSCVSIWKCIRKGARLCNSGHPKKLK
jgi:hypothetical protein